LCNQAVFSEVKQIKGIMKRRDVLKGIMLPLAVILAVALFGCEKDDRVLDPVLQPTDQAVWIGVEGGVFTAMEGNVVITVPSGALTQDVRFLVHELINKSASDFALKTIFIEPLVEFKKPAQLALNYDGCLENGVNVCEAKSILFMIWDDESAFFNRSTPQVCSCCEVNKDSHTVCMCICQTGVIATIAEW
jgi:hypothetical protein